jgi:hypothetical protein
MNAAKPGDWILIGPGDYHGQGSREAGVWVTTPGLHLRGMDRNAVVADGTLPGRSRAPSAGLPPPLYPLQTQVQLLPIPREPGMDDPCQGVPENSWCEER